MIMRGDMIKVECKKYASFPSEKWGSHWYDSHIWLIVTKSESNNGSILAKDKRGHILHVDRMQVLSCIPLDSRIDLFS